MGNQQPTSLVDEDHPPTTPVRLISTNKILDFSEMALAERSAEFIRTNVSPNYGTYNLMHYNSSKTPFAVIEKLIQDPNVFQSILSEVSARLNQPSPPSSLIRIYMAFKSRQSEYCSSFFRIQMNIEYIPQTLSDQIASRKARNSHFGEKEILAMLLAITTALSYLQQHNLSHGFIQPKTILFDPAQLAYKITDIQFLSQRGALASEYKQFLLEGESASTETCHLSPELLTALSHRQLCPSIDESKSEVFALGLTALEMATMKSPSDIYDFNSFTINSKQLLIHLSEVERIYSTQFIRIIFQMLHLSQNDRPNINDLLIFLRNCDVIAQYNIQIDPPDEVTIIQNKKTKPNPTIKYSPNQNQTSLMIHSNKDIQINQHIPPTRNQYNKNLAISSTTSRSPSTKQPIHTYQMNPEDDQLSSSIQQNINFPASQYEETNFIVSDFTTNENPRIPKPSQFHPSSPQQNSHNFSTQIVSDVSVDGHEGTIHNISPYNDPRFLAPHLPHNEQQLEEKQRSIHHFQIASNEHNISFHSLNSVYNQPITSPLNSIKVHQNNSVQQHQGPPKSQNQSRTSPFKEIKAQDSNNCQQHINSPKSQQYHHNIYISNQDSENNYECSQNLGSKSSHQLTQNYIAKSPVRQAYTQTNYHIQSLRTPKVSASRNTNITPLKINTTLQNLNKTTNLSYAPNNKFEQLPQKTAKKVDLSIISEYNISDIQIKSQYKQVTPTKSSQRNHPLIEENFVTKTFEILQNRLDRVDQNLAQQRQTQQNIQSPISHTKNDNHLQIQYHSPHSRSQKSYFYQPSIQPNFISTCNLHYHMK